MRTSEAAWRKMAQDEASTIQKMIESDGRKVMVLIIASEQHDGALKVFAQPEKATRMDVINFITGMQAHIADLSQAAGVDPSEWIVVRPSH